MAVKISAKGLFLILFGLALVWLYVGCSGHTENSIDIDYGRMMEMLSSINPPVIFDVRTPHEFSGEYGHIPGARLIPLHTINDSLDVFRSFETEDMVIVCRTGRRSTIAVRELRNAGLDNIYNLKGGMRNWVYYGGPTER
jgi:hydroxyacylglutathione hydrolase